MIKKNRINASKGNKNGYHAKHYAQLTFLNLILETLPDKMLHQHAINLAAHVLATSIKRELRQTVITKLVNNPKHMPSSIPSNFNLQVNKEIDGMKEFQELKRETDEKILEHKKYLKGI